MDALEHAIEKAGGQAALANLLGLKQQNVWNWLRRGNGVPLEHCALVEKTTGVPRWTLRPDDWHRIWPELIGSAGAPEVPVMPSPAEQGA